MAEKSAERPPLGYLLATHRVGARGPGPCGPRRCLRREPRLPSAWGADPVPPQSLWPQNPVPWAGWLWNLWRKGTSFSNCGHRCVSRLRPWRGWGYRGGRGFAVTLPMDVSLQRFCVCPRERQARGRPAAGPERGGSGLSTTTCCLVNKHEHHSATRESAVFLLGQGDVGVSGSGLERQFRPLGQRVWVTPGAFRTQLTPGAA